MLFMATKSKFDISSVPPEARYVGSDGICLMLDISIRTFRRLQTMGLIPPPTKQVGSMDKWVLADVIELVKTRDRWPIE